MVRYNDVVAYATRTKKIPPTCRECIVLFQGDVPLKTICECEEWKSAEDKIKWLCPAERWYHNIEEVKRK